MRLLVGMKSRLSIRSCASVSMKSKNSTAAFGCGARRAIQGDYSLKEELARLRSMPRVVKGRELLFNDGPQSFSKHFIEPVDGLTQTLHVHLEEYAPGGRTQKHGHVNEAAFYILDGKGYEIHDGIRYDWSAGDIAIVHMNCVHQHFNADPDKPARALFWVSPMQKLEALFNQLHNLTDPAEVVRISAQHEVDFLPPEANE